MRSTLLDMHEHKPITRDVYSAFVDEGKFGGSELFALNEIRTSPVNQATSQTNSESATATPDNAMGEENQNSSPKTTADIYGQMVKEQLEKVSPTPTRPTKKQITPAGEAIVKAVGKSMGVEVVFTDEAIDGIADGKTEDGNTVYISRYTVDPIKVVIKHEFTHSVEGSRLYGKFAKYIFEDSVAFKTWLKGNGYSQWVEAVQNELNKFKEYGIKYKDPYYMAKTEVVAKFVSETLFTDKAGNNGEIAADFLAELRRVDRAWYERFIDWVKSVFARLKETDAVNKDIIKLEQKFLRLVETVDRNSGENKTTTKNGSGTVYSQNNTAIIDLSDDNELSKAVEGLYGNKKYTVIRNYILSVLQEQPITLSDGKKAIVDKNDAKHIASNSGQKKTMQIFQIKKMIENASLVAEEPSTKTGKFDHFYYYEVAVKYDGETYPVYLNVGKARNDLTYHLYDITQKLRDTAHRVNDVGRPGGDALKNGISNNSIPNSTEKVNQYSFVGEKAKTADKIQLTTAKQMLKDGVDSETIRQETGWFKGYDGKWRFEISDNEMHIKRALFLDGITSCRYHYALEKRRGAKTTKEETEDFLESLKKYSSLIDSHKTLSDYIEHEHLFQSYPELKKINIDFKISKNPAWYGAFDYENNTIKINFDILLDEGLLKKTLIHEIQHAIQHIEGFNRGSSNVYWDMVKSKGEQFKDSHGQQISSDELYWKTAGEIEARDSSSRFGMTEEERKATRPDIDRTDVVFAEDYDTAVAGGMQYSIPSDHTFVYNQGKASFTEQRLSALLDEHSLGDGKRAEHSNAYVGYISPEEFLKLTANDKIRGRVEDEAYVLNEQELERESETPFLEYDPSNGQVVNHEGRHRMVALKADGISSVAIVLKPSDDSFMPRTKQDIALVGQSFADSNASGNVTVKNALPLSEKYRNQVTAEFAKNPDADIRYSIPGKITPNMSEQERYELLKDRTIQVAIADVDRTDSILLEHSDLRDKKLKKSEVTKILKKIGEEFDVYHQYANADIEVNFEFGKNNMNESVTKQKGNYDIFAQMLSCFSDVISNAIGIEVHNRNAEGYKPDPTLKNVYVLCSAFENEENVIPVKLSIKEFSDKPNRLYVAVALEGIKKDRVVSMGVPNNRSHIRTSPVTVSISEIFKNVNQKDKDFIKYIPSQFFTDKNTNYSLPETAVGKSGKELRAMVERGEIALDEAFESLTDQYGTLPKGENPKVDVSFPKKISKNESVSRFARTVAESGHLDQGMSERQQKELLDGAMSYKVISDKEALAKADAAIKEDFSAAVSHWQDIINSGNLINLLNALLLFFGISLVKKGYICYNLFV